MKPYSEQQLRCLKAMGLQAWQIKPAFEAVQFQPRYYVVPCDGPSIYVVVDFFQGESAVAQDAMLAAIMKAMQWDLATCDALPQGQTPCWVLAFGSKALSMWAPLPVTSGMMQQRAGMTWLAVDAVISMIRNPQLKKRSWLSMQRFKQQWHEHTS